MISYLRERVRLIIKDSKRYVKEEFLTAKDVVEALKKRVRLIIASILTFTFITAVFVFFISTPKYEASVKLFAGKTEEVQSDYSDKELESYSSIINTYIELIKTRDFINKIIDEVNLDTTPKALMNSLQFITKANTPIIEIRYVSSNPEVAEAVISAITENFEVVNYEGNIDEFLEKFESMENIIGTRFHSVILSQVFNQGLYPFIYSDKTLNVLRDIGLGQEYYHIRNCEESSGKNDKDKFDSRYILDIISSNKINNKELFIESEKQFQELDKYVRESSYKKSRKKSNSIISSNLGQGEISKLSYSNTIMTLINTVILSNIMTYFYPKIAKDINKEDGQKKLFDLS